MNSKKAKALRRLVNGHNKDKEREYIEDKGGIRNVADMVRFQAPDGAVCNLPRRKIYQMAKKGQ